MGDPTLLSASSRAQFQQPTLATTTVLNSAIYNRSTTPYHLGTSHPRKVFRDYAPSPDFSPSDNSMQHPLENLAIPLDSINHEDGEAPTVPDDQHLNLDDTTTQEPARQDTTISLRGSCNPDLPENMAALAGPSQTQPTKPSHSSSASAGSIDEDMVVKSTFTVAMSTFETSPPLSDKTPPRQQLQKLCIHWFTAYRMLIALAAIINLAVLAIMINKNLPYTRFSLAGPLIATAANIFAAVLIRQEDVINFMFRVFAKVPVGLPLWLRKSIADFHHFGGFHIGTSVSALLWYFFFVYLNTTFFIHGLRDGKANAWVWADMVTCYSFLLSIFLVCVAAHPR